MKIIKITDEQYGALKRLGFDFNDIEEEEEVDPMKELERKMDETLVLNL